VSILLHLFGGRATSREQTKAGGFIQAVKTMREHQREYFKHRSPVSLERSKEAEREVDRRLEELTREQGGLFE